MVYKSILGKKIELTPERKEHIPLHHPDLKPYFSKIKQVLLKPNEVRISKSDPLVLLFYKYFGNILSGKFIAVTIKINQRSFILTAYLTKRKLSGRQYEYTKR